MNRNEISSRDKFIFKREHLDWKNKRKRTVKKIKSKLDEKYSFFVYPYNFKMNYTSSKDIWFGIFTTDTLIAKRKSDGEFVRIDVDINKCIICENDLYPSDKRKVMSTFK